MKMYPDNFTNNAIAFNNNIQDSTKLVAPFLKQLSLFDQSAVDKGPPWDKVDEEGE
jgi:hypothetical protein